MDVFEAVRTVLAVRAFNDQPVSDATIRKIVEAAHVSASSNNMQPWHFVVVQQRDTLKQIGSLARSGPYTAQAAFAIVVAIEEDSTFGISDASRAVQSMVLTAWEEGVGSNWVGYFGLDEVGKLLGVPKKMQVLAVIPFGYPAIAVGRGKKQRKPLGDVASRERFGQPFA
jgi:nitroreductase